MEIFLAVVLIVAGLAIGLFGLKLARVLLPLAGLMTGAIIGFTGMQGVFGTSVTSTTIAILVAAIFGLVLAVMSYAFFNIALVVLTGTAFMSLFALLGIALGLSANGFVVGMLSVTGFLVGVYMAASAPLLGASLVSLATSFIGSGLVLAGIFLLGSSVTLEDLATNGIITTVAERVSNSFWWIFVWVGSAIILRYIQLSSLLNELFPSHLGYDEYQVK